MLLESLRASSCAERQDCNYEVLGMLEAIQQLYAAGVDCGIESYQGVGVLAWIVAPGHRRLERCFAVSEVDGIGDWLLAEAVANNSAEVGPIAARGPREILAGLAESRRKGPHRVSVDQRQARLTPRDIAVADGRTQRR